MPGIRNYSTCSKEKYGHKNTGRPTSLTLQDWTSFLSQQSVWLCIPSSMSKPLPWLPESLQTRSNIQKEERECPNKYWSELCSSIQQAAGTGNIIKDSIEGIKPETAWLLHQQSKSDPIKSKSEETITDKNKQLERWVEHYSQFSSI